MLKPTLKCLLVMGVFSLLSITTSKAQNASVESALKRKFDLVQYHSECGGWYFLSYTSAGVPMYGFADAKGNIVVSGATDYKMYPGYMSCLLLDQAKKRLHDRWIADCKVYETKLNEYQRVEAKHKADMESYNIKVQAAEQEATRRWERAKQEAMKRAQYEAQRLQQQSSGSILGAVLSGVAGVASVAAAAKSVKYEPFLNQVLGERNLLVKPAKPYNPAPKKPVEPSNGLYWKSFSLRQPCKYEFIDFSQIEEKGSFADVQYQGKWGLVDAEMNEIIPCVNIKRVRAKVLKNGLTMIYHQNKYGVLNKNAKSVVPVAYKSLVWNGSRFLAETDAGFGLLSEKGVEIIPCKYKEIKSSYGYWLCCDNDKWGIFSGDYDELYPCQFQSVNLAKVGEKLVLYNKSKGLWGVLEFHTGKELLGNKYASIRSVDLGQAGSFYKACRDNNYGLYADNGVMVIPCEFSNIKSVNIKFGSETKPMIEVSKDGTKGLFETNGVVVIKPGKYTSYTKKDSYYEVKVGTRLGACDLYGNELVPCEYSLLAYDDKHSFYYAERNGKRGLVSETGRELFPFVQAETLGLLAGEPSCLRVGDGTSKGYGIIDYGGNIIFPMKNKLDKIHKLTQKIAKLKIKNPAIDANYTDKSAMLNADKEARTLMNYRAKQERGTFSFFAKNYVERNINEWQKKGEFERTDDWKKRVNKNTLNQRVFALTKEAQDIYIRDFERVKPADKPYIVGDYDPDHETYRIHSSYSKNDILVQVPFSDALEFKTAFASLPKEPRFFVDNDAVGLAEYVFTLPNGAKYKYSNEASLTYSIADVKYDFDAVEIDKSFTGEKKKGKQTISTSTFSIGKSDIDINIPTTEKVNQNTFAVIIANENYDNEKMVQYAYNDGQVFRDYCRKTLGLPEENIHFRPDATLNNMKFELNWLKAVTKTHTDAQVIFYYAGHGMPDESTRESYLLPIDGYSTVSSTGFKLSELYASLGDLPANNVLVMLDACFSGADRSDNVMANVRGVRIAPRVDKPRGNVVVFSATSNQQTALPYQDQSHGMFTYFVLKYLQNNPTNANFGAWFDYVKTNVAQKASVINSKEQTPTAIVSTSLVETWKGLSLF